MPALRPVVLATMLAVPTLVLATALLLPAAVPLTTALVSPLTKPVMVSVKVGLLWPYRRAWSFAVTVRCALLMVKVPLAAAKS